MKLHSLQSENESDSSVRLSVRPSLGMSALRTLPLYLQYQKRRRLTERKKITTEMYARKTSTAASVAPIMAQITAHCHQHDVTLTNFFLFDPSLDIFNS